MSMISRARTIRAVIALLKINFCFSVIFFSPSPAEQLAGIEFTHFTTVENSSHWPFYLAVASFPTVEKWKTQPCGCSAGFGGVNLSKPSFIASTISSLSDLRDTFDFLESFSRSSTFLSASSRISQASILSKC